MDMLFQQRKVKRGDTLSQIAEELMGSAGKWQEIFQANRDVLKDPNKLVPGQNLRIPGIDNAPQAPLQAEGSAAPSQPLVDKTSFLNKNYKAPANVEKLDAGSAFMEGMLRRGWTVEEAAAVAGNAHVESGFQPGIKSSVPNENSYGFLQWNQRRLKGLQNMAAQTQRDWTDPEVQMDWINMERTGDSVNYGGEDESRMYAKAFEGGGTPEDMAERFGQFVERPLKLSDTAHIRRAAAAKYAYIDDITDRLWGG
jgi:LysM repeat protein